MLAEHEIRHILVDLRAAIGAERSLPLKSLTSLRRYSVTGIFRGGDHERQRAGRHSMAPSRGGEVPSTPGALGLWTKPAPWEETRVMFQIGLASRMCGLVLASHGRFLRFGLRLCVRAPGGRIAEC